MKVITLPKNLRDIVYDNENLFRYLESLNKKQDFTPRSWLYDGYQDNPKLETDEILEHWMSTLRSLENGSPNERKIFQFDTSQLEKWGPQGGHPPISEVMDLVTEGFKNGPSPCPAAFDSPEWEEAKDRARVKLAATLGFNKLRHAAYGSVKEDLAARDALESNSGFPSFSRRSKEGVTEEAIEDARSGKWKSYPAIALFRFYNQKLRLVWMFPESTNLVEGSFTQPLMKGILSLMEKEPLNQSNWVEANYFFTPWLGFETVKRQISRCFHNDRLTTYLAASDFKSTDAHFTRWCSLEVLDVIEDLFVEDDRADLRNSVLHMHEIPLVIAPDAMITGSHGVASGSNWTNLIETIFDFIFSEYAQIMLKPHHVRWVSCKGHKIPQSMVEGKYNNYIGYDGLCAIGDDMAWITDEYSVTFKEDLEKIGTLVGHQIQSSKTTSEKDEVKFLQRYFIRGYDLPDGTTRGVYSSIRALKSIVFPEREHKPKLWSSDMFCARTFMILENCIDHPLFEEFVKFVCVGNRDLIPFAKKSAADLTRITRETKLLPGFNPTYNQEKRDSSLASFASIDIASKL